MSCAHSADILRREVTTCLAGASGGFVPSCRHTGSLAIALCPQAKSNLTSCHRRPLLCPDYCDRTPSIIFIRLQFNYPSLFIPCFSFCSVCLVVDELVDRCLPLSAVCPTLTRQPTTIQAPVTVTGRLCHFRRLSHQFIFPMRLVPSFIKP